MKIMVVAPGSIYSTYDTYTYCLDALKRVNGDAETNGFDFHNIIRYHTSAREKIFEDTKIQFGSEVTDIIRSGRELVSEIFFTAPDFVLVIDGSKFPPMIYHSIKRLQVIMKPKFILACHITESPYIDEVIDNYIKYFDVVFCNEKTDVARQDPTDSKHVYYLPHSYSRDVHTPIGRKSDDAHDVFFCGTIYPERAKIISETNWSGIDAKICGTWALVEEGLEKTCFDHGVCFDEVMPNSEVAKNYRSSKIVINFGRTYGWTPDYEERITDITNSYSVGPRVIEAIACGAFVISEYRPEIVALFGDSVPTFRNAKELEELLRFYLDNPQLRKAKSEEAFKIVKPMSYDDRAEMIVEIADNVLKQVRQGDHNG